MVNLKLIYKVFDRIDKILFDIGFYLTRELRIENLLRHDRLGLNVTLKYDSDTIYKIEIGVITPYIIITEGQLGDIDIKLSKDIKSDFRYNYNDGDDRFFGYIAGRLLAELSEIDTVTFVDAMIDSIKADINKEKRLFDKSVAFLKDNLDALVEKRDKILKKENEK